MGMKLPKGLEAKILAMAAAELVRKAPPPKRTRAPSVTTPVLGSAWAISLRPECRVVSEANQRSHWAARQKRFRLQSAALSRCLFDAGLWRLAGPQYGTAIAATWIPSPPFTVVLTHVGPRMDSDNLAGAFKGVRDAIADNWLGIDDGDVRVSWVYEQRPGKPGVEIRIEGAA